MDKENTSFTGRYSSKLLLLLLFLTFQGYSIQSLHTRIDVRACNQTHTYTDVWTNTQIHTHTHTITHVHTDVHMRIDTHTHMETHTHTNTHTHTHERADTLTHRI